MPKLRDGVPQVQEIRIMPPKSDKTQAFFKPLMVLKQNVTKPMIENIEIDIPEKGKKYSTKPSVEVIEGDHREMLEVTKGQAVVENAEQRSQDHPAGVTSCSYNFLLPCNFDHSLKRDNTGLYKHYSKRIGREFLGVVAVLCVVNTGPMLIAVSITEMVILYKYVKIIIIIIINRDFQVSLEMSFVRVNKSE